MTTLDARTPSTELHRLRTDVSDLTLGIARLVGARNLTSARIGEVKRDSDQPIVDASREHDLLSELLSVEIPGLDDEGKFKLVGLLTRLSKDVQGQEITPTQLIEATAPSLEALPTHSE
jgi:chorismate mutase